MSNKCRVYGPADFLLCDDMRTCVTGKEGIFRRNHAFGVGGDMTRSAVVLDVPVNVAFIDLRFCPFCGGRLLGITDDPANARLDRPDGAKETP